MFSVHIKPNTFAEFKRKVTEQFPDWRISAPVPLVYITDNQQTASIFTLARYAFTKAQIEQVQEIANQCAPDDTPPARYFMPHYQTREQVRKLRTKSPALRRKKVKSMADAFR